MAGTSECLFCFLMRSLTFELGTRTASELVACSLLCERDGGPSEGGARGRGTDGFLARGG